MLEQLGRFFRRGESKRLEETKTISLERQFTYKIDSVMYALKQKDGKAQNPIRVHFNRINFGHREAGDRREHFFEETVLRDDNGIPIAPYVDIYETQKGTLKHSKKMLMDGDRLLFLPDASEVEVEKISAKLDRLVEIFGQK